MDYIKEIIERDMSYLDYLLIMHIKNLRQEKKISQQTLSKLMGVSPSFVGNVENLLERHKYSIRHLALLKKAFNYKSIPELFNFPAPNYDKVNLRIEVIKTVKNNKLKITQAKLIEIIPYNLL